MKRTPAGAPEFKPHRAAYKELLKTLQYAYHVFHTEGDGGIEGARLACRAIARFIGVRHEPPELAGPFLAIFEAFGDLSKGITPELFSVDATAKERSRSSQRKHMQATAAASMEVLMELGSSAEEASRFVAKKVAKWPQWVGNKVTPTTITNWRNTYRGELDPLHVQFLQLTRHILSVEDPRAEIESLLSDGPPGVPGS
jgi:hypothetical protein